MRDYLEELLDLLTQEDEEAAEGWGAQAASLLLDKPLEAGGTGRRGWGRIGLRRKQEAALDGAGTDGKKRPGI